MTMKARIQSGTPPRTTARRRGYARRGGSVCPLVNRGRPPSTERTCSQWTARPTVPDQLSRSRTEVPL